MSHDNSSSTADSNLPITHRFSFWVLIAIIGIVGLMFYRVMAGFVVPMFLAAQLVLIFQPLYDWLQLKSGGRRHVAGTLATIAVVLIVFVPTAIVFTVATSEAVSLGRRFDSSKVTEKLSELRTRLGLDLPLADDVHLIDQSLDNLREFARHSPPTIVPKPVEESEEASDGSEISTVAPAADGMAFPSETVQKKLSRLKDDLNRLLIKLSKGQDAVAKPKDESLRNTLNLMIMAIDSESAIASSDRLEATLVDFSRHWEDFKLALLGGPLNARLKELANPSPEEIRNWRNQRFAELQSYLLPFTKQAASVAAQLTFGALIMVISVFFFFVDGPSLIAAAMRLTPLDIRHQQELMEEFANVSRAVVLATLLAAVAQGMTAGLGFWFAGLSSVAFLILITTVFSMIPFVGAVAVWVPVCLWMFVMEGQTQSATMLALYCAVVVSQIDNVIKPLILQGKSKLHPLLALLSILGGVQALGPIGILIGPMVVVFLQTLLNILRRELNIDMTSLVVESSLPAIESKALRTTTDPVLPSTPVPPQKNSPKSPEKKGKRK